MEDIQSGVAQAGEYLLQVGADQDRLGSDEVLAGEATSSAAVATTSGRHGGQCWKSAPGYRSCSVGRISSSFTATCRGRVTM
jgi:hypothetical protein